MQYFVVIDCIFFAFFRRTRGSRNPVKRLMDRQDLVVREEELRHTEDKENKVGSAMKGDGVNKLISSSGHIFDREE